MTYIEYSEHHSNGNGTHSLEETLIDSTDQAVLYAQQALLEIGMPCRDDSTVDTPRRFVHALRELTRGLDVDPSRHFARTFPMESSYTRMITVRDISFVSVCEHHLLPFTGFVTVGYVPVEGANVVGLSKLARVTREFAARPQMQERLGDQIVHSITSNLRTEGAGCMIRSVHSCMALRGVAAAGAEMVTSHYAGCFEKDVSVRSEFMALTSGQLHA